MNNPCSLCHFSWLFALSLGSYYLDPQKQDTFTLVVSVKDMAGKTTNAFTSSVDVIITVRESLWKAPPIIHIKENSTQAHPVNISKVGSLTTLSELLVPHNCFLPTNCEGVPTASNTRFFRRTLTPHSYFFLTWHPLEMIVSGGLIDFLLVWKLIVWRWLRYSQYKH